MDFITNLPPSNDHSIIMIVVDRFSKSAHFGTLPAKYFAYQAAGRFAKMICKLHGYPRSIICDRALIFLSKFRKLYSSYMGLN